MTADEYVESILAKYAVARGPTSAAEKLGNIVAGPISAWAGTQLNALEYSGSYAKQTGVHGVSDVDLFVSLKANTTETLKQLYEGLHSVAQNNGWSPRAQNVSIGISIGGTRADLVPAKVQSGYQNYHSLYLRKRDSWTQTNVALHIQTVRDSGRIREIRAIKIWKHLRNLDWPSLYLELFVIDALRGRSKTALADNVLHVLRAAEASLASTRIVDPGNSNNIISDDLTTNEKHQVAGLAGISSREKSWGQIIW
jgi:hypothetical protein